MRQLATACLLAAALGAACLPAQAGAARFCDRAGDLTAGRQDRMLRVADVIRQLLEPSGRRVALISRSGLDLQRFGIRYSHAGLGLQANPRGAWAVRQLYYACDESRPRLYDQGLAGFLLGNDDPNVGFISIVTLPEAEGGPVERTALSPPQALDILAATYSANAYAFSTRYQNCNQWVMELLASAWGGLPAGPQVRHDAQHWLRTQGYEPTAVPLGSHAIAFAAHFVPLIHVQDHPPDDLHALTMHISMPTSIEAFVRKHVPQAERIELCHTEHRIVVRRGWTPIGATCEAGVGDEVVGL